MYVTYKSRRENNAYRHIHMKVILDQSGQTVIERKIFSMILIIFPLSGTTDS